MAIFTEISGCVVILRDRGLYRQCRLFIRGRVLYAGLGSGFVKLYREHGGTSRPSVAWEEIEVEDRHLKRGPFGELLLHEEVSLAQLSCRTS